MAAPSHAPLRPRNDWEQRSESVAEKEFDFKKLLETRVFGDFWSRFPIGPIPAILLAPFGGAAVGAIVFVGMLYSCAPRPDMLDVVRTIGATVSVQFWFFVILCGVIGLFFGWWIDRWREV